MRKAPKKVLIAAQDEGSCAAHLLPLIKFLTAQGNTPSRPLSYTTQDEHGFNIDRDGYGKFLFDQPLDLAAVNARFALPPTIHFTPDNGIWDSLHKRGISQTKPANFIPDWN